MVISTMSPGGLSASIAATMEKLITAVRVQSSSRERCLKGATRFLYRVDAATNSTLSMDDIAAARIETMRKSVAHIGKTAGSFTSEGTIKSVSVTWVNMA